MNTSTESLLASLKSNDNRYATQAWAILKDAQNLPKNENQDIMTITGFMNDEKLVAHIQANV